MYYVRSHINFSIGVRLQAASQLGNGNPERPSDNLNVAKRDIAFAPLDSAYIGAIQPTLVGKGFLRKPKRFPQLTDTVSEPFENVGTHSHGIRLNVMYFESTDYESHSAEMENFRPTKTKDRMAQRDRLVIKRSKFETTVDAD